MTKSLPRMFSPNCKIVKQDEVSTTFRVVGIPFGGPDYLQGKDLHGQYFDKTQTDYGKNAAGEVEVKTLYAYYDHALNDKVGKDNLGYAKFYGETDDGQLWDIEVLRAYRYHDMLLALAEKNLLGASSQPVQTAVEIDWDSGLIKRWPPAEISLTPTPANPDAVVQVVKSFNVDLLKTEDAAETETETEEELPTLEEIVNGVEGEIDELFNEENDEQLEPSEDMKAIVASLSDIKALVETLKSEQEAFQTKSVEEHRTLATGIANTQNSLKSFAGHVATKLKMDVREIAQEQNALSEQEKDAEDEVRLVKRLNSGIPADAPGKAKKGSA